MQDSESEITQILKDWGDGDRQAPDRLMELVYDELHRRARLLFWSERPAHTLQPTALVNEAYLRLVDRNGTRWESRFHFYRVATRVMRHRLIDHARRRLARKRDGGASSERRNQHSPEPVKSPGKMVIALYDSLRDLNRLDARQSRIVELRYFAGLTIAETAAALGCSIATVNREWRSARIWLRLQMAGRSKE